MTRGGIEAESRLKVSGLLQGVADIKRGTTADKEDPAELKVLPPQLEGWESEEVLVEKETLDQIYAKEYFVRLLRNILRLLNLAENEQPGQELIEAFEQVLTVIDSRIEEFGEQSLIGVVPDDVETTELGILSALRDALNEWNVQEIKDFLHQENQVVVAENERVSNQERPQENPRNDFEKYFLSINAGYLLDIPEIPENETPEQKEEREHLLHERYTALQSIYLSVPIAESAAEFTESLLKYPDISHASVRVPGSSTPYTYESLFKEMTRNIKDPVELKVATEVREAIEMNLAVLGVLHEKKELMLSKGNQSIGGAVEVSLGASEQNANSHLNGWFWQYIGKLPRLGEYSVDRQEWVFTEESLGQKIFTLFQEMVRCRVMPNAGETYDNPYLVLSGFPKELHSVYVYDSQGNKIPKEVRSLAISRRSILPWLHLEARGDERANKRQRADELKASLHEPTLTESANETFSSFSLLQALSLAEITFETSMQDVLKKSGYEQALAAYDALSPREQLKQPPLMPGKPMGLAILPRLLHPTEYISKDVGENKVDNASLPVAIAGSVHHFFLPFLDYFGYGGMTFAERLAHAKSFDDEEYLDWSRLPESATFDWGTQVRDGATIAEAVIKNKSEYDMTSAGELDFKRQTANKVNVKFFASLTNTRKTMRKYQLLRDGETFSANVKGLKPKEGQTVDQINPTGQYIRVVVRGPNGQTLGNQEMFTRINQWYHFVPSELQRRMENDEFANYSHYTLEEEDVEVVTAVDDEGNPTERGVVKIPTLAFHMKTEKPVDIVTLFDRELIYKFLMMVSYDGNVLKRLQLNDLILMGIFLSSEMKERFLNKYYDGIGTSFIRSNIRKLAHRFEGSSIGRAFELLTEEDLALTSIDIMSADMYHQMLSELGYKYTLEDWQQAAQTLFGGGEKK